MFTDMYLCVCMSYQSIVLCYQNEAIVVNEVAVNILLKKQSVKAVIRNTMTESWNLTEKWKTD